LDLWHHPSHVVGHCRLVDNNRWRVMSYTVIYPNGTQQQFYIRSVAEMYAQIGGGRVVGKPQLKLVDRLAA
jgi:hypothetical protein